MSIQVCIMAPIKYLELFSLKGDMLFALPHISDSSKEYNRFYQRNNKYKILDSGVIELGKPYSFEKIVQVAKRLKVNEIAIPDYLHNAKKTIESARNVSKLYKEMNISDEFNLMGIAQGTTVDEWLNCFEELITMDEVSVIGIGIYSVKRVFSSITNRSDCLSNRMKCVELLVKKNLIPKGKNIHLLGLGDPIELVYQKQHPFVRSCDTTRPIIYGLHGIRYTNEGFIPCEEYKGKKMDYFMDINPEYHANILQNIEVIKELAK